MNKHFPIIICYQWQNISIPKQGNSKTLSLLVRCKTRYGHCFNKKIHAVADLVQLYFLFPGIQKQKEEVHKPRYGRVYNCKYYIIIGFHNNFIILKIMMEQTKNIINTSIIQFLMKM